MKDRRLDLDTLWDFHDPRGSERRFLDRLRQTGGSGADEVGARAETQTQLARAQALQRRFRLAHRTLDRVARRLPALTPRARIRYFLERGRVFRAQGQPTRALPRFLRAWRLASRHREQALAVDAAHMVALVTSGPRRTAWNARALRIAERSRDPAARRWKGSILNNIGWSQFGSGRYDAALRSFRRALRHRRAQGVASEVRVARWCVARALRQLGRTSEALRRQRALAGEWARARQKDGYVFEELGECLLELGRPQEARPFFRRAHAELSRDPSLRRSDPDRLKRLRDLGDAA